MLFKVKYNESDMKLFGIIFVKNNRNIIRIIYKNKAYKFFQFFSKIEDKHEHNKPISIKLKILNNTNNISYMFYKCTSLVSLEIVPKKLNPNIMNINSKLNKGRSLKSLPDKVKLNIINAL